MLHNFFPLHLPLSLLQGNLISPDHSPGIIVSNQTLVIQKVRRNLAGKFTCHAKNAEGEVGSNEIVLNIKCEYIPLPVLEN